MRGGAKDLRAVALAAYFHLMQPVARLKGRLKHGLTIWRKRASGAFVFPWRRTIAVWAEKWAPVETRLTAVQNNLRTGKSYALAGGSFDPWDIEVRSGLLGGARVTLAPEEHGAGNQNLIFRIRPFVAPTARWIFGILTALSVLAATHGGGIAAFVLGLAALGAGGLALEAMGLATGAIEAAIARYRAELDQATTLG